MNSKAEKLEKIFRDDCFAPKLRTHKVDKRGIWAFSVTRDIRIKFVFEGGGAVTFIDIGPHDRVYRR